VSNLVQICVIFLSAIFCRFIVPSLNCFIISPLCIASLSSLFLSLYCQSSLYHFIINPFFSLYCQSSLYRFIIKPFFIALLSVLFVSLHYQVFFYRFIVSPLCIISLSILFVSPYYKSSFVIICSFL